MSIKLSTKHIRLLSYGRVKNI